MDSFPGFRQCSILYEYHTASQPESWQLVQPTCLCLIYQFYVCIFSSILYTLFYILYSEYYI